MAISIEDLRDSSISSGTHDSDTLINRFMNVLRVYAQDKYDAYVKENPEVSDYEELDDETKGYIVDELFDLMNDIAPEGTYFGASEGDGADFGFWTVEESCKTEKTYTAPYYLIDGKKANHTDMISLAARMGLDPNQRKYNGVIDMAKAIVAGTHKPKKGALSDKSIALAKEFLSRVKGPFKEESKQGKINEGPGAGYTIKITSFEPNSGRLVAGRGFNRLVVTGHIDWEATGYDWKAVDNEYPVTLSIDLSRTLEEFEDIDGAYDARMQTGSLTDFVNDNMDYIIGRLKFDDDGYSYGGGYTFSCPSDGEFVFGANLVNDGYDNFVVEYDYKARDGFTIDSPDMADEIRWVHDTQSDSGKVESKQSEADYARASKPVADAYKVLDNYYLDNGKLSDFLTEQVLMTFKNDGAMYSRSKSKAVKSHSLAWESLLATINALLEWDDETEHATKLTSEQVKNWFKANGMDYKEALKPLVDAIENQRKEWFGESKQEEATRDYIPTTSDGFYDENISIYAENGKLLYQNSDTSFRDAKTTYRTAVKDALETYSSMRSTAIRKNPESTATWLKPYRVVITTSPKGENTERVYDTNLNWMTDEDWRKYESKKSEGAVIPKVPSDAIHSKSVKTGYYTDNSGLCHIYVDGVEKDVMDFDKAVDAGYNLQESKKSEKYETVDDVFAPVNPSEDSESHIHMNLEGTFVGDYTITGSNDVDPNDNIKSVDISIIVDDSEYSITVYDADFGDHLTYSIRDEYGDNLKDYISASQGAPLGRARMYAPNEVGVMLDDIRHDIEAIDKGQDEKKSESKQSEKLTQKDLKQMATSGAAIDITNVSDEEAKEIRSRKLDTVAISRGTYGMNGALLKDKEGKTYVITARNSNLFYFV